jgi:hypothetical protein
MLQRTNPCTHDYQSWYSITAVSNQPNGATIQNRVCAGRSNQENESPLLDAIAGGRLEGDGGHSVQHGPDLVHGGSDLVFHDGVRASSRGRAGTDEPRGPQVAEGSLRGDERLPALLPGVLEPGQSKPHAVVGVADEGDAGHGIRRDGPGARRARPPPCVPWQRRGATTLARRWSPRNPHVSSHAF